MSKHNAPKDGHPTNFFPKFALHHTTITIPFFTNIINSFVVRSFLIERTMGMC